MIKEERLIDANVVLAKQFTSGLSDANGNYYGHADVIFADDIANAPTVDAVEVVRCKDCAYATCNPVKLTYGCRHPSGLRGFVNEGFYFCSYGERRTNERKSD